MGEQPADPGPSHYRSPDTTVVPGARSGHMERLVWRVAGAAFTLIILACGTVVALGLVGHRSEVRHRVYHHPVTRIVVDGESGDLTVVAGTEGTVTVRQTLVWSWSKPTSHETWDGQTLRLRPDCGIAVVGDDCRISYLLSVPPAVAIEASTGFGDITIDGVSGEAVLKTETGTIVVADAGGRLSATSHGGRIRATNLTSSFAQFTTDQGDVDLVCVTAPRYLSARSNGGDVSVVVPRGEAYLVNAGTGSGSAGVSVLQDPVSPRTIAARTGTGNVTVRYP